MVFKSGKFPRKFVSFDVLTKSLTLEDTIDGRSFMCKRKSIGPKTVPCGTPESTSTRPEDTQSTTTHCLRFF